VRLEKKKRGVGVLSALIGTRSGEKKHKKGRIIRHRKGKALRGIHLKSDRKEGTGVWTWASTNGMKGNRLKPKPEET